MPESSKQHLAMKQYITILFFVFFSTPLIEGQSVEIQLFYLLENGLKPAPGITFTITNEHGESLDSGTSDIYGKCLVTDIDNNPKKPDAGYLAKLICKYNDEILGSADWKQVKLSKKMTISYPQSIEVLDIQKEEKKITRTKATGDAIQQKIRDLESQIGILSTNNRADKHLLADLELEKKILETKSDSLAEDVQRSRVLIEDLKYWHDKKSAPYLDQTLFNWSIAFERPDGKLVETKSLDDLTHIKLSLDIKDKNHRAQDYYARVFYTKYANSEKFYFLGLQRNEKHPFTFQKENDNNIEFRIIRSKDFLESAEDFEIISIGVEIYYKGVFFDIPLADCYCLYCENYYSKNICTDFNDE